VFSIALIAVLMHSRIGYYLRSIRDDAIAARSMGVNVVRYKVLAFIVASVIAGMAGAFYGHSIGLISPVMGDFNEMAMIIIFVVIGGMRTQTGPVVGAIAVRITMELLRGQSEIRIILLSALVIIIMRFFNGGLMDLVRRVWKMIGREQEPVSA
jgi:branched-chain amino acid transport system permease protein